MKDSVECCSLKLPPVVSIANVVVVSSTISSLLLGVDFALPMSSASLMITSLSFFRFAESF